MTSRITAIDHLMIHVANSEAAGRLFEQLGFFVTPKSAMPGLSNRLVCFGETDISAGVCNYIELMQLEDGEIAPPPMPQLLRAPGPVSTVMSVDDARAVTARLTGEGLKIGPVIDLQRDWDLGEIGTITPRFSVGIPELGQAPIYWNYCQHRTPELYALDGFINHANSARVMTRLYAAVGDVDAAAAHYERHWQAQRVGNVLTLPGGGPFLQLDTPEGFAESLPAGLVTPGEGLKAMAIAVADPEKARELAQAAGAEPVPFGQGWALPSAAVAGCGLIYELGDA